MKLGRRQFSTALIGGALMALPGARLAAARPGFSQAEAADERRLHLCRIGDDETIDIVYYRAGYYQLGALAQLDTFLRDIHTGEVVPTDPALLDRISTLQSRFAAKAPFRVVCGHRSATTNNALIEAGYPAASNSFHLVGRAIDLFHPGISLERLNQAAIEQQTGGVGFYPGMNFIHLDTGPLRDWTDE